MLHQDSTCLHVQAGKRGGELQGVLVSGGSCARTLRHRVLFRNVLRSRITSPRLQIKVMPR